MKKEVIKKSYFEWFCDITKDDIPLDMLLKAAEAIGEYDHKRDYIGAEGSFHHRFLGGFLRKHGPFDYNPAGWLHDGLWAWYAKHTGRLSDKIMSDAFFYIAICAIVKNTKIKFLVKIRKKMAYDRGGWYHHFVLTKGGKAWDNAKKEARNK